MLAAQETALQGGVAARAKRFFRGVKAEMKKVTWPTKQELISYTGTVFVAVVFIAVLIWLIDMIFAKVLKVILR